MDSILKQLESPKRLNKFQEDVDNFIKSSDDHLKSLFSINLLNDIRKYLSDPVWFAAVDPRIIYDSVSIVFPHISIVSDVEYQNYLTSTYFIYQFLLKKGLFQNDLEHLKFVFNNTKLGLKSKYYKIYWNLIADAMNFLNIKNKETCKAILPDLLQHLKQLINICDVIQFYRKNLSWLVRKLHLLLFEIAPDHLENAYECLFNYLNSSLNVKIICTNDDPLVLDDIFNSVLICYSCLIQSIPTNIFANKKCSSSLLELSLKLFKKENVYNEYFGILISLDNLINVPLSSFPHNHYKHAISIINKLKAIEKNNWNSFQEFVVFLRKVLNFKFMEWMNVPKNVWKEKMTLNLHEALLQLINTMVDYLKKCSKQGVKCVNCNFESGHHDAFQLATFAGQFIENSAPNGLNLIKTVQIVIEIYNKQLQIILHLQKKKCPSWMRFWRMVEKSYQNNAIFLHSAKNHELSLNLFSSFMSMCTELITKDDEIVNYVNFARALYNMSICYFDSSRYDDALRSCYLSMALNSIYNQEASLHLHVQVVIQIKTKMIAENNSKSEFCKYEKQANIVCECFNSIIKAQSLNVWNACNEIIANDEKYIYCKLLNSANYLKLLLSELEILYTNWFSTVPVIGICKTFKNIYDKPKFVSGKSDPKLDVEMLIILGKIVTLINSQFKKLYEADIADLVKFALLKYESFLDSGFKSLNDADKILINIFYGNILFAVHEIIFYEKLNADKFSPLPTSVNIPQSHVTTHPDDECDLAPTHLSLRLSTEDIIIEPILKAINVWKEILNVPGIQLGDILQSIENKVYVENTFDNMESAIQILSIRGYDVHSITTADIIYSWALRVDNKLCMIRTVGIIVQNANSRTPKITEIINSTNSIVTSYFLKTERINDTKVLDTILEYLLNLSIHYYNCNLEIEGIAVLSNVQKKILDFLNESNNKISDIQLSYAKLIDVQSLYLNISQNLNSMYIGEFISYFTSLVNAYVEYTEFSSSVGRNGSKGKTVFYLWLRSGLNAGKTALLLGLPRRARAILKSLLSTTQHFLLSRRTVEILLTLAETDISSEKYDDCRVKLDIIHYITEERFENTVHQVSTSNSSSSSKKIFSLNVPENQKSFLIESSEQFEVVLDSKSTRNINSNINGSPTLHLSPFEMPSFVDHKNVCLCSKCTSVILFILVLKTIQTKINLFYRTNEIDVAQSFVNGGFKLLKHLNAKLNSLSVNFIEKIENFKFERIDELVNSKYLIDSQCHLLKDICFILIKENNLVKAEYINNQIMEMLPLLSPNSFFLLQSVYEQKIFFMQSKLFSNEANNTSNSIDDLAIDLIDKLAITPEKNKIDTETFKTPRIRVDQPPKVERIKRNKGKCLFEDIDPGESNHRIPAIKFNLVNEDLKTPKKSENKKCAFFDMNAEKTPLVKHQMKNTMLCENLDENVKSVKSVSKTSNRVPKTSAFADGNTKSLKTKDKPKSINAVKPSIISDTLESENKTIKTRSRVKVPSEISSVKKPILKK